MTRRIRAAAAMLAVVLIGGCSPDGDEVSEPFLKESVMGVNARVGDILLRSVHVEAPQQPRYEPGDRARLWFTLLNEGRQPDTLTGIASPYAAQTQIRFDDDCDGDFNSVTQLTLHPAGPDPVQSPVGIPAFDAYHAELDLTRQILAGSSIPVIFTFLRAGTVTVEALVQPSNAPRPEATLRCDAPAASPSRR